ncbi:hypothetical protein BT69DRAFT_1284377, partial [Atractiella rhizophila]
MCLVSEEYRNCGKDDSEREDAKGCIMMCIEVRQLLTDPTNLLNKCMKRRRHSKHSGHRAPINLLNSSRDFCAESVRIDRFRPTDALESLNHAWEVCFV